jgi:hypothetical protein
MAVNLHWTSSGKDFLNILKSPKGGAIGLSRAVSDEGLSRALLKTVGELLKKEARE